MSAEIFLVCGDLLNPARHGDRALGNIHLRGILGSDYLQSYKTRGADDILVMDIHQQHHLVGVVARLGEKVLDWDVRGTDYFWFSEAASALLQAERDALTFGDLGPPPELLIELGPVRGFLHDLGTAGRTSGESVHSYGTVLPLQGLVEQQDRVRGGRTLETQPLVLGVVVAGPCRRCLSVPL